MVNTPVWSVTVVTGVDPPISVTSAPGIGMCIASTTTPRITRSAAATSGSGAAMTSEEQRTSRAEHHANGRIHTPIALRPDVECERRSRHEREQLTGLQRTRCFDQPGRCYSIGRAFILQAET